MIGSQPDVSSHSSPLLTSQMSPVHTVFDAVHGCGGGGVDGGACGDAQGPWSMVIIVGVVGYSLRQQAFPQPQSHLWFPTH
tara:strand:- start:93 stop:335 length:243 start_codon:yes stop_codon:yes gene_type:complete